MVMSGHDAELDELRAGVSCAALLEQLQPAWLLDKEESTPRCLKYRRGAGEVLIVNHDGRGWWDPLSDARGDVFSLTQHLDPRLNFGQVRRLLRGMVGLRPSRPEMRRGPATPDKPVVPVAQSWARHRRLGRGSATWNYLTGQRALPEAVLKAADRSDAVREGPHGSAWFAHRDHAGGLTGIDMRGPDWRGFSKASDKSLFRLPSGAGVLARLAVCEAPIDALSLAALEGVRADTLYLATTGGMGPLTLACLDALLRDLASQPEAVLVAATDADEAGERHARRLAERAQAAGVRWERLVPPGGQNDWNDVCKQGKHACTVEIR